MKWNDFVNPPKWVRRLSVIAAFAAGEIFSVYAVFIAHTMNPVSYRLVEHNLKLRAIYGRYEEIYNWDGLLFTLVASFAVFALAWCAVRGIAAGAIIATPGLASYSTESR